MIKERILFVGIGQAGGNIANEMEKRGYFATYINTSSEDLSTLETESQNIFHIPTTTGCSKNKAKARQYVKKHYKPMISHIKTKYPNQDIIYFVFSASGGTGAGIGPMLLDVLSDTDSEIKSYNSIMVLPSTEESNKCLVNGLNTYQEITEIANLKSLIILDNSKGDKLELNASFARIFDKFISSSVPDVRGNIDSDEMKTLLTGKGVTTILPVVENNKGEMSFSDKVFVDYTEGCGNVGILCTNEDMEAEIKDLVQTEIGYPEDIFIGYTDKTNMVIVTEMNYPDSMINGYQDTVKTRRSNNNREGKPRITSIFKEEQFFEETVIKTNAEKIKPKEKDADGGMMKKMGKWF